MVCYGSGVSPYKARATVISALTILSKKNLVSHSPEGYRLTSFGINRFQKMSERRKNYYFYSIDEMDKIRIDILSWELRKKKPISI